LQLFITVTVAVGGLFCYISEITLNGILHQAADSHRTHPTRYFGDIRSLLGTSIEIDVARQTEAALFLLKDGSYNGVVMPVDKGWSSF